MIAEDDADFITELIDGIRGFPKSTRYNTRHMAEIKEKTMKEAVCLGAIHSFRSGTNISVNTSNNKLSKLQFALIKLVEIYKPNFKFTSIQINKNFTSGTLHIDGNVGPSLTLSVGDFEGGQLYINNRGCVDTHNKLVLFNGQEPHMALPYTGKRYSFVFFTSISYLSLPEQKRARLAEFGYPLPNEGELDYFKEYSKELRSIPRHERLKDARENMPYEIKQMDLGVIPDGHRGSISAQKLIRGLRINPWPAEPP